MLFQLGQFTLNSGKQSEFKLECDALTDDDWQCLAHLVHKHIGPFNRVVSVPKGGDKLANYLTLYACSDGPILIVDDVLTTGNSIEKIKSNLGYLPTTPTSKIIGCVVFARGKCPHWVKVLFQMPQNLFI